MGVGEGQLTPFPFNCDDQSTTTWKQRADLCAELMTSLMARSKEGFSLADVGCGDEKLRAVIKASGIRCKYHGYDLFPQGREVRQLNVEKEYLPQAYDLGVMLGVIEYLECLEQTLRKLAERVAYLIVSHVIRQNDRYTSEQLNKLKWRNHLSEAEIETVLDRNGFVTVSRSIAPDRRTMLFACRSRMLGAGSPGMAG